MAACPEGVRIRVPAVKQDGPGPGPSGGGGPGTTGGGGPLGGITVVRGTVGRGGAVGAAGVPGQATCAPEQSQQ